MFWSTCFCFYWFAFLDAYVQSSVIVHLGFKILVSFEFLSANSVLIVVVCYYFFIFVISYDWYVIYRVINSTNVLFISVLENSVQQLVNFRGQPGGTIAAIDNSSEELDYDQVNSAFSCYWHYVVCNYLSFNPFLVFKLQSSQEPWGSW